MSGQLVVLLSGAAGVVAVALPFFWSAAMAMAGPPRRGQAPPRSLGRW